MLRLYKINPLNSQNSSEEMCQRHLDEISQGLIVLFNLQYSSHLCKNIYNFLLFLFILASFCGFEESMLFTHLCNQTINASGFILSQKGY